MDLKELKQISQNLTVLYVEDDEDIANSVINYLSKLFKEVVYACNGADGLELYKQDSYDLVITDIRMPKMNGLDMTFEIKKINENQNIVIISAYSEVENFLSSIKLGVDGYIIKPINYIEMNKLLYKMARKITIDKENKNYVFEMNKLINEISLKNTELNHYTDALNKVAIVSKTDAKGVITFVNDFFCDVAGYNKEELIGEPHNIVRHPDMPKTIFKNLWEAIQSGKVWEGDIKNKTKNGEPYYVHATIIPLYEIDGVTLREYIGIRFLTTKDENEKREFKKKVMLSYQEFKKDNEQSHIKIKELENELEILKKDLLVLKTEDSLLKITKDENSSKYNQQKTQNQFLEDEMKKTNEHYAKILEMNKKNNQHLGDSYKTVLQQIDKYKVTIAKLKEDKTFQSKEIVKLTEHEIDQRKIIAGLKDTIKHIHDSQESSDKKGMFGKFI